jgi:hypothetical protein
MLLKVDFNLNLYKKFYYKIWLDIEDFLLII